MAKNLTAALALLGATAAAGATPVTISQTISLDQLLSAGGATNISFNLNSQLATAGQSASGIFAGDLVVFGYSDAQYNSTVADPYGGYALTGYSGHTVSVPYTYYQYCSSWSWSCYSGPFTGYNNVNVTDYQYTHFRDVHHIDDVADTMVVMAGAASASGSASTLTSSTGGYGNMNYESTGGSYNNGYAYYYNRERDTYEAIAGALQATLHLDALALADVGADGILTSTVSALLGTFHVTGATLTVQSETKVPEPGTLALLALAAAGGVAARRRKKK